LAKNSIAGLLLAVLCAASMWFYVDHVMIPHQRSDSAGQSTPRGNLSDLYPRWLGSRELLLHHRNPYSPEITREIQRGYYGRELDPNNPEDPKDQQAFAYPVYVAFLLAPSVGLPFDAVRTAFWWVLTAATMVSVWLWLQAIGWKPGLATAATITLLVLASFPVVQALKLQQLTLLVAFLISLGVALLARDRLFGAGIVLAIATIKPQLVLPLLLGLLLWTFADWTHRQRFFWGFAVTTATLLGASEILLPGWVSDFRLAIDAYRRYVAGPSLLGQLLSIHAEPIASAILLAGVVLAWWRFRRWPVQSREFQYALAGTLAVTLIVIPMFAPYNQVILFPAILLVVREAHELWNKNLLSRILCSLTAAVVAWPWVISLGLMIASIWLSATTVERGWAIPLYVSPVGPFVLLIQIGFLVRGAWGKQAMPAVIGEAS
jgi:hypothetical protein